MNTNNLQIQLFKIRENRIKKWKRWCSLLDRVYKHEAQKSLASRAGTFESIVHFELQGNTYGVCLSDCKNTPETNKRDVDEIHETNMKECTEKVSKVQKVYLNTTL